MSNLRNPRFTHSTTTVKRKLDSLTAAAESIESELSTDELLQRSKDMREVKRKMKLFLAAKASEQDAKIAQLQREISDQQQINQSLRDSIQQVSAATRSNGNN